MVKLTKGTDFVAKRRNARVDINNYHDQRRSATIRNSVGVESDGVWNEIVNDLNVYNANTAINEAFIPILKLVSDQMFPSGAGGAGGDGKIYYFSVDGPDDPGGFTHPWEVSVNLQDDTSLIEGDMYSIEIPPRQTGAFVGYAANGEPGASGAFGDISVYIYSYTTQGEVWLSTNIWHYSNAWVNKGQLYTDGGGVLVKLYEPSVNVFDFTANSANFGNWAEGDTFVAGASFFNESYTTNAVVQIPSTLACTVMVPWGDPLSNVAAAAAIFNGAVPQIRLNMYDIELDRSSDLAELDALPNNATMIDEFVANATS